MLCSMRLKALMLVSLLAVAVTSVGAERPDRGDGPITEASIRGHMEFLASDAMQGRGSGTADEWRTAAYIASNLRRWGIEPLGDDGGYVQQIDTGVLNATTAPVLVAGALRLTHGREMLVQSIGKGAVRGPLFRYAPDASVPDGAFVLVPTGVTPVTATLAKAAAVLTEETSQQRTRWDAAGSRLPGSAPGFGPGGPLPPSVRIVLDSASHAALSRLADGTAIEFEVSTAPGRTWNAIGQITGRDRSLAREVILLSAHLDHLGVRGSGTDTIYNGADDDASGTTAVLELAEALAKGPRRKRTVIFVWFGSEEAGGFGARAFIEKPPVPLADIVANLEFEMIGRADTAVASRTLWLTGYERSTLGVELAEHGARLVQDPHPEQNFFERSDNIALARAGVIAHTVSSFNLHKEYHTPADGLSHIDFNHMTMAIRSMHRPIEWLLNSKFVPSWYENCRPSSAPVRGASTAALPASCHANGKPPRAVAPGRT